MTAHATHQATLVEAMLKTRGPVLELGCGEFSTRILHAMCEHQGRKLLTLDNNAAWLAKYHDLACEWHQLRLIADWQTEYLGKTPFGLVFVDHAPAVARVPVVMRLIRSELATTFVIHDAESDEYGWQQLWPLFRSIDRRTAERPWTAICRTVDDEVDETRLAEVEASVDRLAASMTPAVRGISQETGNKIEDALAEAHEADGFAVIVASTSGGTLKTFQATQSFPTERIADVMRDYLMAVRPTREAA